MYPKLYWSVRQRIKDKLVSSYLPRPRSWSAGAAGGGAAAARRRRPVPGPQGPAALADPPSPLEQPNPDPIRPEPWSVPASLQTWSDLSITDHWPSAGLTRSRPRAPHWSPKIPKIQKRLLVENTDDDSVWGRGRLQLSKMDASKLKQKSSKRRKTD